MSTDIQKLLGDDGELLEYRCKGVPKESLVLPGPDFVDRVLVQTDRSPAVLRNLGLMYSHGRLGGTGYLSILPVDQGIEHAGGSAFAPNPIYFDPERIAELAVEGGCNALASTCGVLGAVSRKYAHKIPFILKLNHNEMLSCPNSHDQIYFASVDQAFNMGAVGVGATVYFGSAESRRQIIETARAFEYAHSLGLFTVLWCYIRNEAFEKDVNYQKAADLTGQANHLGVTIQADIVKQKQPSCNGGYVELKFGHTNERVYSELAPDHPIEWTRYQVLNSYNGRVGLINSGGASSKDGDDVEEVVRASVINKRAGGMGMITGRKAFQKPMKEGVSLLNAVQDVYLSKDVTIA